MNNGDPAFWQRFVGTAASAGAGMFGYHKYLDGRFSKKADKESIHEVKEEISRLRDTQGKVFDQIRENEQRAQDRYERLMERLP